MALQDKLREGLYDSKGRPRLFYARNYFKQFELDVESNFQELKEYYLIWKDFDEYLVLQKQSENQKIKGKIERKTIATKCAKRENDVYCWRIGKRLKPLYDVRDYTLYDPHNNIKSSNIVFVTLTNDIKLSELPYAWEIESKDFMWIRNLRKKFGRISYVRSLEASEKGCPHIHILMIFHDLRV